MEHPNITKLYKYRALDSRSLDMLSRSIIWLAPSHAFNDPFDCKARRKFEFTSDKELIAKLAPIEAHQRKISPDDAIAYLKQLVTDDKLRDEYLEKKSRSFQKVVLQSFGIYTLSKTPKEILMWSHYADRHKGFCIEYRRSPDNMLADAQKVMYPKDDEFRHIDYFNPDANKRFEEMSKIVLTKSQRWEYEKEWRILQKGYVQDGLTDDTTECDEEERLNMALEVKMEITTKSRHRRYQKDWRIWPRRVRGPYSGHESTYPDDMLRGIIFGLEMSEGDRKEIRHVLSGKNVKYYEARPVTNRFELRMAEIK